MQHQDFSDSLTYEDHYSLLMMLLAKMGLPASSATKLAEEAALKRYVFTPLVTFIALNISAAGLALSNPVRTLDSGVIPEAGESQSYSQNSKNSQSSQTSNSSPQSTKRQDANRATRRAQDKMVQKFLKSLQRG